ncbi:hypothetical protein PR048_002105 [Dryococelus australis]|uniref:Retroviral polymerase SH3-like domain-containing protein n=1 Tax=Dryococelus australis TaxID=614101 RepID=A0ABQ9IJ98_9NEOP|nr:hypothetical protein PR048_002105 [Dryococelus australis]
MAVGEGKLHDTLVETARTLMYSEEESLPKELWAEMINSAAYILNRTGPSSVKEKSPFELWIGRKPGMRNIRVIASKCWDHIPKENIRKFDKKAQPGVLVGHEGDNEYRVFSNNKLTRARYIIFQESLKAPIVEKSPSQPINVKGIGGEDQKKQIEDKGEICVG